MKLREAKGRGSNGTEESGKMGTKNTIGCSSMEAIVTLVRAVPAACLRWQLEWN